jgi:hypothetical protein
VKASSAQLNKTATKQTRAAHRREKTQRFQQHVPNQKIQLKSAWFKIKTNAKTFEMPRKTHNRGVLGAAR